jgi:hypothetical protein
MSAKLVPHSGHSRRTTYIRSMANRRYKDEDMEDKFEFPGDERHRMRTDGDDLSQPRTIDFEHQFSKKRHAPLFLAEVCGGETKVSIRRAGQSDFWDVQVSIYMVPAYQP